MIIIKLVLFKSGRNVAIHINVSKSEKNSYLYPHLKPELRILFMLKLVMLQYLSNKTRDGTYSTTVVNGNGRGAEVSCIPAQLT